MKQIIIIICVVVSLSIVGVIFAVSSSGNTPKVWIPPKCDGACQMFHETIESLSPLKCDTFEGVEHTLCQIKRHINFRDSLVFYYGFSDIEHDTSIINRNKCENRIPVNFETCFYDNLKGEDIEKILFEFMKNLEPDLMSNEDDADIFSDALSNEYIENSVERIQKFIEYVEIRERLANVYITAFIDFYNRHKQQIDDGNFIPDLKEINDLREARVQAEFGLSEDKLYIDLEKTGIEFAPKTLEKLSNTLSVRYTYDILRLRYNGDNFNTEHLKRIEQFFKSYETYLLHDSLGYFRSNFPEKVVRSCHTEPIAKPYQGLYECLRDQLHITPNNAIGLSFLGSGVLTVRTHRT